MRRVPNHTPRTGPCVSIASTMYEEHVGVYRQAGGNIGLMKRL